MGYTHYWRFKKNGEHCAPIEIENGEKKFKSSVKLFKKCLEYMGGKTPYPNWGENAYAKEVEMKLCGGLGNGEPEITDTLVCFNGDRKTGNDHETFYISLTKGGFNFCKTARKPYDTAVWVCLLCFKYFFGENLLLSSDGDDDEHKAAEDIFDAVKK